MGMIATAVRHLIAAGVTGDALLRAIEEMEAAGAPPPEPPRSSAAVRQERYRRNKASQNRNTVTPSDGGQARADEPRGDLETLAARNGVTAGDAGGIGGNLVLLPQEDSGKGKVETQPARRGKTYLPADFHPDQSCRDLCDRLGFTDQDRLDWLEEFRDWCASKRPMYADWQATARNSIKRHKRQSRSGNYGKPSIKDSLIGGAEIWDRRRMAREGEANGSADLYELPGLREGAPGVHGGGDGASLDLLRQSMGPRRSG